ncbi:16S rRNA (guanine(527)-N(7))-methyltransferase RsmG [Methylotenera sp. G11]|uniref:16S rRNA (guanine(527)-N(7))-methyltransferase RsmG n=1 Tax=Methylotenera sp. G11 TaxID=1506585 RepID=UPI0009E012F8|nr:16S rRNA (guanine(527)-N(7))-methyltransferase RsmG [Methylotenera sp. G11]
MSAPGLNKSMPANLKPDALAQLRAKLETGLQEMGLQVTVEQQQKLLDYVALIYKWNQVHNLTAVREPMEMVTLHILDSLSVLPYIDCKRLLDVGAGAGLPSIPLAICLPGLQVTAIDAVQKKVIFMRQAKAQLGLANFNVIHGRIEDQEVPSKEMPEKFDVITSRAFSEIGLFVKLTKHLLADGGRWLAMKGIVPQHEFDKSGLRPVDIKVLKVAGLDAERHLIILE